MVPLPFQRFCALNVHVSSFGVPTLWFCFQTFFSLSANMWLEIRSSAVHPARFSIVIVSSFLFLVVFGRADDHSPY